MTAPCWLTLWGPGIRRHDKCSRDVTTISKGLLRTIHEVGLDLAFSEFLLLSAQHCVPALHVSARTEQ